MRHPAEASGTAVVRLEEAATATLPRPTVGIVLAAGRSERLQAVTGGGSKALVRIGGLSLVERAIRRLLAAGMDRVVVVVGYHAGPVAAVARRTAPGVQVVVAEDWEEGNGASLSAARDAVDGARSFLLVTADHLFSDDALDPLVEARRPAVLVDPQASRSVLEEATRVDVAEGGTVRALGKGVRSSVADCGAFLLGTETFAAAARSRAGGDASLSGAVGELARGAGVVAVPLPPGAWWIDVDTPEDLRAAVRLLRRSLRRPGDGPVARFVNRNVSVPISWVLAPLRPSPDLISVLAFAVGLAAAGFVASGAGLVGGLLAQACSILDGVDGEVARLTMRAGPRGTLFDGVMDRLGDAALCGGLGVWAVAQGTAPALVVLLAVGATTGAMLSMSTKDRIAALGLAPPSEWRLGWFFGGRDARLAIIAGLSIAGLPAVALAVTGATSLLASAVRVAFARARA